ncbi:MAG: hypothetical protein F6K34_00010 [Okeania sp. SIO4D6]|nr:hypothetical protein [Okeania sp. SIO4D6]
MSLRFGNKVVQERIIDDQEFCSLEDNNRQVILAKTGDRAPSVRPGLANGFSSHSRVNRPTGASGLKPVKTNTVQGFRTPRGLITSQPVTGAHRQPTRLEGAGNPGGGGGGASFDDLDQCPVPENQKSQESKTFEYDSRSNFPKKKNKSAEQCELDENVTDGKIEIVYRIKEDSALIREAKRLGRDQAAQKDVNNLIEQLSLGNNNPGIGNRRVKNLKNVSEARGRNEGRVYFREKNGKIEILAKSNKDNQNKVIGILQKMGY